MAPGDAKAKRMIDRRRGPKKTPSATAQDSSDEDLPGNRDPSQHDGYESSEEEAVKPRAVPKPAPGTSSTTKKKVARSKASAKRKKVAPKKRPQAKPKRAAKKKAPDTSDEEELPSSSSNDESNVSEFSPDVEEEEEENNDSEESWDSNEVAKKKMSTRAKKSPSRSSRRDKVQSDESDASWDSDKKKPTGRPHRPKHANRHSKFENDESEASWHSSDVDDEGKAAFKTPVRGKRRRAKTLVESSGDNDGEESDSPRKSTPRESATRARARIQKIEDYEEKVESENELTPIFGSGKRKKNEDAEFNPDTDDDEPEDDSLGDNEIEESAAQTSDENDGTDDGNVDAVQDFLTADSSNDENATGPSPMLDIKYTAARRRKMAQEDDSSSDEKNEIHPTPAEDNEIKPTLSCSPHMPDCPTEVDAITMATLPEKHICYFPPDQMSRQCFALETLHKIALTSSIRKDGKIAFLQPPHFRTPASDDLIDQIASRFGRAALDLSGDFYKRGIGRTAECDYTVHFGGDLSDDDAFQDCLNEYISHLMGSQDVYCCPLCYIEAHRRLANVTSGKEDEDSDDDSADERGGSQSIVNLWHDPMTVLGFPDSDKYTVASTFCFSRVANVKRHLREAHNVDTKVIAGNDLYSRFKVRF